MMALQIFTDADTKCSGMMMNNSNSDTLIIYKTHHYTMIMPFYQDILPIRDVPIPFFPYLNMSIA